MQEGPDIAHIAALIGDPARTNMLSALMAGKALTASELAHEARITSQTASAHLSKLRDGWLVSARAQERLRYYGLDQEVVVRTVEGLIGLASKIGHLRTRTGLKDPALRIARVCYNHLAGKTGIQMFRALRGDGAIVIDDNGINLSPLGVERMTPFGIDVPRLTQSRTPLCRECLDWSALESHLAGSLSRALLARIETLGWAARTDGTRIVTFSKAGRAAFDQAFPQH